MKLGLVVALVLVARAARADEYPQAVVDRPLNLLPGMTALYVDEELSSRPDTFDYRTPSLAVAHGFGPVEVYADLGEYAELHVSLTTHRFPESIEIYGLSGAPQRDDSLHVAQGASVGQRFHVVPGLVSISSGIGIVLGENRYRDPTDMLQWSQVVSGFANANLEVQVLPQLELHAGLSGGAPLAASSGLDYSASLGAGGGLILALGTWDIYAAGGIGDVTDRRLPYLTGGFAKFWGG